MEKHAASNLPKKSFVSDLVPLIFIGIFVALAFKMLQPGYPAGFDSRYHYKSLDNFYRALTQGQLPVRWVDWNLQNGTQSMPVFNFYQVGFYYLASVMKFLVGSTSEAIKLTVLFLWETGGLFMFLFMKKHGRLIGLLSALLYIFTPYVLSDIFVRGAFPELTAITFFTGCFWLLERAVNSGKQIFFSSLSLLLAFALVSHILSALILLPILLAYAALITHRLGKGNTRPLKIIASFFLSFLISSFYLLPSLFEKNLIHQQLAISGYNNFHHHFPTVFQLFSRFWGYGPSVEGPNDGMSFQIGIIQAVIFLISAVLLIYRYSKDRKTDYFILFWLGAVAYCLFFTLPISLFLWEHISFLAYLQFPWRFLMVIPLSGAMLGGMVAGRIKEKRYQNATAVIIAITALLASWNYLKPSAWMDENRIMEYAYFDNVYLPEHVSKITNANSRYEILEGDGVISPEKAVLDTEMDFRVDARSPMLVEVKTHYFPGWRYYLDSQENPISRGKDFGFMRIRIPAGKHQMRLRFSNTPARTMGNMLSIGGLSVLVLWTIMNIQKPQHED